MSMYHIYAIYCKIKQTGVLDYLYSFGIFFVLFCFFIIIFQADTPFYVAVSALNAKNF